MYKFPVPQSNGKTFIGCSAMDITKWSSLDRERVTAEQKFKTIFEYSPDPIFIENEDGIIIDANRKACELRGMNYRTRRQTHHRSRTAGPPRGIVERFQQTLERTIVKDRQLLLDQRPGHSGRHQHSTYPTHGSSPVFARVARTLSRNREPVKQSPDFSELSC